MKRGKEKGKINPKTEEGVGGCGVRQREEEGGGQERKLSGKGLSMTAALMVR